MVSPTAMKRWIRSSQNLGVDTLSRTTGFLLQLAPSADGRVLPRVEAAGGDLVDVAARRVPVLLYQDQLRIVTGRVAEKGHHRTRPGVAEDLELPDGAVREAH